MDFGKTWFEKDELVDTSVTVIFHGLGFHVTNNRFSRGYRKVGVMLFWFGKTLHGAFNYGLGQIGWSWSRSRTLREE